MENVEIPDDFYITEGNLCHKSCLPINGLMTNDRYVYIHERVNNANINELRNVCNKYDKIEEITHFVDGKYNYLKIYALHRSDKIIIINIGTPYKYSEFKSFDEALQYLQENYPECIRNVDIKIALKD